MDRIKKMLFLRLVPHQIFSPEQSPEFNYSRSYLNQILTFLFFPSDPTIRDVSVSVQQRIFYVRFAESHSVTAAQHLTNTVFIDRALICIPVMALVKKSSNVIP